MRKALCFLALAAFVLGLAGSAAAARLTSGQSQTIAQAQAEPYNGPKACLSVGQFTDKTAKGQGETGWYGMYGLQFKEIGDGMRNMLTTALFNTNRFIVLEREQINEVLDEQDLGASGRVKKETAPPVGEIYGADLIITGAVTEFEGSAKGVGGGTRVLGVTVSGGLKKAHMAIDVRIIDAKTSQIVAATMISGSATNFGAEGATNIGGSLPVALGGFSKTPTEQAIRNCIQKAVDYIVTKTPAEYYRQK
jgi:curli biogenesis system outer membrane secretion channel CsgG